MKVPFLPKQKIEQDAEDLLAEFSRAAGKPVELPIAIDDIVEKFLKIGIEFDDTHRLFDVPRREDESQPDILGAIFFEERRIVIDESLDPDARPGLEGRYRFTLAHEGGGHWRLHRDLYRTHPDQHDLFDEPRQPPVVCRSSQSKAPIEWQADFYASCLLMPRDWVRQVWVDQFGDLKARGIAPLLDDDLSRADPELARGVIEAAKQFESGRLEDSVRPMANRFKVSPIAMRIRLEEIGLLFRSSDQRSLAVSNE